MFSQSVLYPDLQFINLTICFAMLYACYVVVFYADNLAGNAGMETVSVLSHSEFM